MASTWPGIRQIRALLGVFRDEDPPDLYRGERGEKYTLVLDLAPLGTNERVDQLKRLAREFQRLTENAADAYKEQLRPGG